VTARVPVERVQEGDHVRGADDAAVTIIEYGDYGCPHTRASQAVVDRLLAANPDVRVVFRHFPLQHLHAHAEPLARVAEAAGLQGKFWEMHDHLMRHHRTAINEKGVLHDAVDAGLDVDQLGNDMDDDAVRSRVERDVERGHAAGVHSTPTFFFNGALHDGHYDEDTLAERLTEARGRG
jgi:protein-disulfide isomerase